MILRDFVEERQPVWSELEALKRRAGKRAERLGPDGVRRLGELYRSAAADLALARHRYPGDPIVKRLETLVGGVRHLVYDAPTRRGSLVSFFRRDYWRLVAEKPAALVAAAVLTFAPAVLAGAWAHGDPQAAVGLVPADFRPALESKKPWHAMPPAEQAAFTTTVFTNNIRVALTAFAGGVTLVITGFMLLYNGVILGAIGGIMIGAGNTTTFIELVTAHGVLELSCIIVAGAAGLRVGWAIVDPGRLRRVESAVREGRRAVAIALGTAPWLVAAGIFEGFRAPFAALGVPAVMVIGFSLGTLYWTLVWRLGRVRPTDAPAPSSADTT